MFAAGTGFRRRSAGEVATVRMRTLFGSLGATGRGHGSDKAVLLGLEGAEPDSGCDRRALSRARTHSHPARINACMGKHTVPFVEKQRLLFRKASLPYHPNGMRFSAFDAQWRHPCAAIYYSVGGGFVVDESASGANRVIEDSDDCSHSPSTPATSCWRSANARACRISQIMLENEKAWRSEAGDPQRAAEIWRVMQDCVRRGCHADGILPGGMKVRRRAAELYDQCNSAPNPPSADPLNVMDWVNIYAIAVNEENASGGRVVTAPTNGAAGIIPAVMHYYAGFVPSADDDGIVNFLLAAGAIGTLYKKNASISGADVGCQGEVGVACSMAAAGLAEARGATPRQVENAAEIGMEHNLGLTCDPVGGLVQIPCIERNAMGAVKAINAAAWQCAATGKHFVSLDKVIKTMRETGADMKTKYKETARGGLAVNVIEC
jgi:L-serine dehydratase